MCALSEARIGYGRPVTELVPSDEAMLEVGFEVLRARAQRLAESSRADNTRTAYESDMDHFRRLVCCTNGRLSR